MMNDRKPNWIGALVLLVAAGLLVALLVPAIHSPRGPIRSDLCRNNLKQISLALSIYASTTGEYPPAYTVDDEGTRLHSWRTLILPQLGRNDVYALVDLTKPWDDPANAEARAAVIDVYQCPEASNLEGLTTYLAIVGPGMAFTGSEPRQAGGISLNRMPTLQMIDAPASEQVHWMSPQDLDRERFLAIDDANNSNHARGTNVAMIDGSVRTLVLSDLEDRVLDALLTIAGDEELTEADLE